VVYADENDGKSTNLMDRESRVPGVIEALQPGTGE
jgi:hypothetical protein